MNTTAMLNITVPIKLVITIAFSIAVSPSAPSKRPVKQKKIAGKRRRMSIVIFVNAPQVQPPMREGHHAKEGKGDSILEYDVSKSECMKPRA